MKKIYINKEIDFSPIIDKINDIDKRLMEIEDKIWTIEKLKQEYLGAGFEADEIFLPSIEEYEKYKDVIPHLNCWWWLRTEGKYPYSASAVNNNGSICDWGCNISNQYGGVRPMIQLPSGTIEINAPIGAKINLYNFPWVVIDKYLAIAEAPIGFEKFDSESNDYEHSYVRKFLLDWMNKRR